VPAEFYDGERVSLVRILAKIVAIPGPLVTPKAACVQAQSLPRCKRLMAVIAYHYG
jgi:hypothetical protein